MGGDSTAESFVIMYLDNPLLSRKPYGYLSCRHQLNPFLRTVKKMLRSIEPADKSGEVHGLRGTKFFLDMIGTSG